MKQLSKVLTLILFSSLFFNLSAQEGSFENDRMANSFNENRKFRLGLQFNPNLSWLKVNTSSYKKEGSNIGLSYGLSTEFFLTKNYLISTGLFITALGGELSYKGLYTDNNGVNIPSQVKQSYNLRYVEIPFTLKLRTNQIGYMTYYGNFGLRAGVKYKSSSDFTYSDINNQPKVEDVNTASDVFFINTWLVVGAGAEYNISGNTNLNLGFSYNNGLINTLDAKTHQLDANGNASVDSNGNPVFTGKKASANINYFSLEIGVYF